MRDIYSFLSCYRDNLLDYKIEANTRYSPPIRFKKAVATYASKKLPIKNCFTCRYHAKNRYKGALYEPEYNPIFCKFLKITCNSNKAVYCEYYKLELNYVDALHKEVQDY